MVSTSSTWLARTSRAASASREPAMPDGTRGGRRSLSGAGLRLGHITVQRASDVGTGAFFFRCKAARNQSQTEHRTRNTFHWMSAVDRQCRSTDTFPLPSTRARNRLVRLGLRTAIVSPMAPEPRPAPRTSGGRAVVHVHLDRVAARDSLAVPAETRGSPCRRGSSGAATCRSTSSTDAAKMCGRREFVARSAAITWPAAIGLPAARSPMAITRRARTDTLTLAQMVNRGWPRSASSRTKRRRRGRAQSSDVEIRSRLRAPAAC